MGFELHLKFYFALNLSLWQGPFEPTTLDGYPLTIVCSLLKLSFFLLYNTTEKPPSVTYHNTSLAHKETEVRLRNYSVFSFQRHLHQCYQGCALD